MKIAFVVSGEGRNFESIRNGSMAKEFLTDYNIEFTDHGDYLRIAVDQIARVDDIESLKDVKYFCQKYCCDLTFNGGRPLISFRTLPEEELPIHNVWDLKEHTVSKLRNMYVDFSQQVHESGYEMTKMDEQILDIIQEAIDYVQERNK